MRVDIDARVAVYMTDEEGIGFNTVRVTGDATDLNPARLVLLRRHADMADETPDDEARSDVERGADEVAAVLNEVSRRITRSEMALVVERAHDALKNSGTYYSVLVAVVTTTRVVAAGIGNMNAQIWTTSKEAQPVLDPTTTVIGHASVLSSALGLGYASDQIQTADLALRSGDQVIVGVEVDLAAMHPVSGVASASEVLQIILERTVFGRSAIVGVIAGGA